MIADSSVWIERIKQTGSAADVALKTALLGGQKVLLPDIVLQEVLQGALSEKKFRELRDTLSALPRFIPISQRDLHVEAANIYRRCRDAGFTIRRANDCLIAACAIESNEPLLHRDRDFLHIAAIDKRLLLINV